MRLATIRLLHQMARSGGTLISRSLACMAGVVLLSEVHALANGFVNPLGQAQGWFGLFDAAEWTALKARGPMPFADAIALIEPRAVARGQALVLREWSHLDFTGVPLVAVPPCRSTTAQTLEDAGQRLVRFASVRHPLDQLLSLLEVPPLRGLVEPAAYMQGCRRFAGMAVATRFVRYEDYCADPAGTMRALCHGLDVPFDPTFLDRQVAWTRITGDQAVAGSRAAGVPRGLARREAEPRLLEQLGCNDDYRACLDLLGYRHVA